MFDTRADDRPLGLGNVALFIPRNMFRSILLYTLLSALTLNATFIFMLWILRILGWLNEKAFEALTGVALMYMLYLSLGLGFVYYHLSSL